MVWEYMEKGMASAAWVAGFVAVIGLFLVVVGLSGYLIMRVFDDEEEEKERTSSVTASPCHLPYRGRHQGE